MERYCIASFKSRNQTFAFERKLKQAHIQTEIVNTPHKVAIGCSLSIRFEYGAINAVRELYHQANPTSFVGFYLIVEENGRLSVKKI